jgi:hypothetical protein
LPLAVTTIFAKNYLSYVRVLAESLRRRHPDVPLVALLIDDPAGDFDPSREPFQIVRLPNSGSSSRSLKQIAAAAKPSALRFLLDRGHRSAIFLDPDILVRDALDQLFTVVEQHAVALTPHLIMPPGGPDGARRELNILSSGTFNAGFIGVSDTPSARQFLAWWDDRVAAHCRYRVADGVYYDQRWLDLAPVFFDDVSILRDPVYNVAHWNLPERDLMRSRFVHFSGFDPDRPDHVTRYADRITMTSLGEGAALFAEYAVLLRNAGYDKTRRWTRGRWWRRQDE